MFEINWIALTPETSYYQHSIYLLKKRRIKGYYVYSVMVDGQVMFNTYNQYEFERLAGRILRNEKFSWKH